MAFVRCQFLLALSVVCLVGCSGGGSEKETAPAMGVVKVNGKPVGGATVTFYPEEGKSASGETDADGKFTLTTYETGDGAVVGKHKVTVTVVVGGAEEEMPSSDPDGLAKLEEEQAKNPIPEKYRSLETTDLTKEVKSGEDNNFDLEL